ncbi:reverse transcriptase domain-containing protein [Tanacetum coccineum]|uniref:Reverse transcriptase domain-containing protein n=1 Tax=Tanacetum coccineum TaxID=301880 RepID=A0ABQ4Y1H3_9ASTR
MSFMTGILLDPFQFPAPKRRLTMEEMVNKFIEEGRREHEKIDAFIREFKTTNKLLYKERNNSLSELRFEVHGLTRAFEKAHLVNYEIKGVTTRGGKTTAETTLKTNATNKPSTPDHDKPVTLIEAPTGTEPKKTMEPKISPIPFPHRLRKEKEEAQQQKFLENLKQLQLNIPFTEALAQMPKYAKFLKSLMSNKTRLEKACEVTMNERCSVVFLNKLPPKEKDPGSFTIPCNISDLHINNALADLGASISLMPYLMYEKLGLGEPKPTKMSLELTDRFVQYGVFKVTGNAELWKTRNKHLCFASASEIDEKKPELKDLPSHLEYAYLKGDKTRPVIISSKLIEKEKVSLLQVLEKHEGAIAWKMSDIKGISPSFYTHKILMEENFKPFIQPQ